MFASRKILFFSYALALACFFFFPKLSFACFTSSTYNAWGYCRAITINQTWVASSTGSEAYTNFPVLFSEASDSNLVAHALSTGNDILFLGSDDATKLNDEIEHYTSSTGEIEAWVNMSSISTSSNTVFYMYYGNSGASNQQNVTGTWNSNYQLVDHLGSNSGNLNVNDSTSNADNGTSSTAIATTTGEIDGAASFNGSQEYQLTTPIVDQTTSSFTFSTWVYTMASNTSASLLGVESGSGPSHGGFFIKPNVNGIYVDYLKVIHPGSYLYSDAFSSSSLSINAWHLVDFVNTLGTLRFYIDGALDVNTSVGLGINLSLKDIGDDSLADNLQGKLDELRYANTARSADWVKTEWNNQSAPSSFYTIGSQQNDYHITTSPTALSNNHSGQITLTLTGLGTSWVQGSTIFSLSGVSNITKVSQNITTSTAATIVVTTGIGTGTLTISDGTGSVSVAVSPETLSVFPTSTNIFATTTLTFTGVNTAWNQETSSTLFSVSGVSGASLGTPTITGNGAATALLTLGTTQGTLTITDNSTGATTTILAGPPTIPASSTYILLSEPGAEYSTLVGHNLYVNMLGYPYPEGQYLINTQTNTSTFINSDGGL